MQYCKAGLLCKDFNLEIGLTCNIKIGKSTSHFIARVHFTIINAKLITRVFITPSAYICISQASRLYNCKNIIRYAID